MIWAEAYAGGVGGFVARLRHGIEPPPHAARRQYFGWCRSQGVTPENHRARLEQVILFTVSAWDANCPQHIPQRFEATDVTAALAERDDRIKALEAEPKRLRSALGH